MRGLDEDKVQIMSNQLGGKTELLHPLSLTEPAGVYIIAVKLIYML